jgi:peptidoglycan/LPS O-acetylase OafA/YrhL
LDTAAATTSTRYRYLDALRGLAALWVVVIHVAMMPQPRLELPSWFDIYVTKGVMGVELFFVVSAFSLCLSMPRHSGEERPLLGFALRRFFRIAPLFYLMIIVTAFFNPANFAYNWTSIAANMLFIFNFVPGHGYQTSVVLAGWTIGVEMVFYLIFPFVYARTRNVWLAVACLFISLAVAKVFFMTVGLFVKDPGTYHSLSIFFRAPIFMFGLIAFYATPLLNNRADKKYIGAALLAAVPVLFYSVSAGSMPIIEPYYWEGLMFACLVVGLGLCPIKPLVNPVFAWLGEISYSVYLVHSPIIVLLFPVFKEIQASGMGLIGGYMLSLGITLLCVISVAALTFRFFENRINEWGKAVATNLAGKKQAVLATA